MKIKKIHFKYVVAFSVAVVAIVSMFTGNAQYAIELAKIGGGVLAGYFAGYIRANQIN